MINYEDLEFVALEGIQKRLLENMDYININDDLFIGDYESSHEISVQIYAQMMGWV